MNSGAEEMIGLTMKATKHLTEKQTTYKAKRTYFNEELMKIGDNIASNN